MPNQVPSGAPKLYVSDTEDGATNRLEITNYVSMTEPSISEESTDITDSSTAANSKESLPGDTDYGDVTLTINAADPPGAGQTWLEGEMDTPSGALKYYQLNNGTRALAWSARVASGFSTMERGSVVKILCKQKLGSRTKPVSGAAVWT